jgi:cation transport ATPase
MDIKILILMLNNYMNNKQTYNFHVNGMHCNACVLLIESELNNYEGVVHAKVLLNKNSIEVIGDFGDKTNDEIRARLIHSRFHEYHA